MKNINEIKVQSTGSSKNSLINGMFKNTSKGLTENGAITYTRTQSSLLDFYAQAGAMRKNPSQALKLFQKAYSEDRLSAIKILFYLRDVRGGQGERVLFRTCLQWLGEEEKEVFEKVVGYVSEYGRWDDLFFDNEVCMDIISKQLTEDKASEKPSLLAKWMPTINASSKSTKAKALFIANKLGLNDIAYRKTIREIRKKIAVVEEKMSDNKWEDINYSHVPSQASRIYKNAFKKHDEKRYGEFIDKAEKGEVKINASTLYPYQIYNSVQNDYSKTLEALWNQLPDYTQGKNALVVADTSGSMSGDPMSVSVSLALYFAERNKGQFKDYFITFSESPRLLKITGPDLRSKMRCIETGEVANTNLQAVFDLILGTAMQNNTPAEEMPETIYIISDMEFDSACGWHTNHEEILIKYQRAGYKVPNIVYWNVDARSGQNLPVQHNENNVAMVSGFSPVIFKMAVENKTPEQVMFDTINSERYAKIII
jgi:predicted RNase H-like HicB family nuclease